MERLKLRHGTYLNVGVYFDIYSTTALRIKTGVSTVCAYGKDCLYEKRVSMPREQASVKFQILTFYLFQTSTHCLFDQ